MDESSEIQKKRQEEEDAKERSFARSKLFINNNVFTTKIEMNDNAHPLDPRVVQEEHSTYIPKPFAAFVTSLRHVRTRDTQTSEWFDRPGIHSVGEVMGKSATEIAEKDIYVFAMLCGLRSMYQEATETVDTIKEKARKKKSSKGDSSVETGMNFQYELKEAWNDHSMIEKDSVQAMKLADEYHGAKKYQVSPHNRFALEDLVRRMDGRSARCVPPRFAAVIERYKFPSTSVSVFSPGKVVCTGARTEAVGHYAIMETLAYIREKGFPRACPLSNSLEAENVVGTVEHDFSLDIEALHERHPDIVTYNKEAFPGATVRPPQIYPAAQLAFESGKIVTMGGRGREGLMRILSVTFALYYEVRKEKKPKRKRKKKKSIPKKKARRKAPSK